ncbi:MAG TPA: enoyl-CoA hydratase-related protein [Acidimicrobiales bacterium]|jgi:enoyl-CoA hydratase
MSDVALLDLERRPDGVAVITLNRPKANALSLEMLTEISAAAAALTEDPPGAVVITGGPRIFAAGADVTQFGGRQEAIEIGDRFLHALNAVAAIPRVTIAAVSGYALGGGCELALACDLRMAGSRAVFGQPEILLGIIPGGGGTQRLARLVGASRAKDLILSGRQIDAGEAHRIGLVDEIVADGTDVTDAAIGRAATLATGPLVAHALAKRAIDEGLDGSMAEGLELEQRLFADVFDTEDATSGVVSFLEHGPGRATFAGR